MGILALYCAAAIAQIAGCFALWAVGRNDASGWWVAPGILLIALFGWLLTRGDVDFAGVRSLRAIYIAASLAGACIAIEGALIILYIAPLKLKLAMFRRRTQMLPQVQALLLE